MDLTTIALIAVIGVPTAYAVHRFTRGNPSKQPKPTTMSFMRGYPKFLDLRTLNGGTLVKNGVRRKQSGKLDVTYKKGFGLPNGLVVAYPTEELTNRGGKILNHWIKQYQKLDLRLEEFQNAFNTLLEMESNETSTKKAREQMMRLLLDIEEVRRPLKAETDRARQSLEFTQTTPETKKPVDANTNLGVTR
jgi:hypothetical protein